MIVLAVHWYLRFNLSYRNFEGLLVERGVEVDHVTVFQRVRRFTSSSTPTARSRLIMAG
jgi:transposase-like protein